MIKHAFAFTLKAMVRARRVRNTVNSLIFAIILFSRIALKDVFARLEFRNFGMINLHYGFVISRGFYFLEAPHPRKFA